MSQDNLDWGGEAQEAIFLKNFSVNIIILITFLRMTKRDFSKAINLKEMHLHHLLSYGSFPKYNVLKRIEKLLHAKNLTLSIEELFQEQLFEKISNKELR